MEHKNGLGSGLQIRKIIEHFRFPSLFSRLVSVYISILVIMLAVLFITFTHAFQSYFVKYTQDMMMKQARALATEFYDKGTYAISKAEVLDKILYRVQVMDSYLQATTWILDQEGEGLVVTKDSITTMDQKVPDEANLAEVFEGRAIGLENGFKEYFSTPVLTIGYPMMMGETVQYALFIHTPMPYVLQTIDEVRNLILNVVGIVGSVMFVWIYFISKQMTKPLKEMNAVAKTISSGQLGERIVVKGQDEIAELGLALNHMAEELDKIEETRRSFIANVSHDLRSPLTSIQGFVTAILDGTISPEKQERYLKIVLSETQRMIGMTNTILELNKMEELSQPLNKTTFNIHTIVERNIASLEKRALEKGVSLTKSLNAENPYVLGDVDGITRVVQNLLDNAMKFVGENGFIEVRTEISENKMWVSFYNSGPPIPKEQQGEIWSRFYKGDPSRGKDKRGVGLGLVIVKEVIKQHGETVGVYSEENKPVIFYFSLSLSKQD